MTDNTQKTHLAHFVVNADGEICGEDLASNREIVRRIQACVNACEGLSTEELERGIIADMRRVLTDVVPLLQKQGEKQPAKKPHWLSNQHIADSR
jgi:hypothetical protein